MSPSPSTFTSVTRPVKANHRCSEVMRDECRVKCALTPTPGQPNICDGVIDRIFDLSVGGMPGSVFAGQRSLPCAPWETHGDEKVTTCFAAFPKAGKRPKEEMIRMLANVLEFIFEDCCYLCRGGMKRPFHAIQAEFNRDWDCDAIETDVKQLRPSAARFHFGYLFIADLKLVTSIM